MKTASSFKRRFVVVGASIVGAVISVVAKAQTIVDDPIEAAQRAAATHPAPPVVPTDLTGGTSVFDPIRAAQVLAAADKTFPNLTADLGIAELLRKAVADPTLRGSLRGRIAEADWLKRNAKDGWQPVANPNAPQNDAWRRVGSKSEGAQVKVHADPHDYIRSMQKDYMAERFVLPDDHFTLVYNELETRRLGAISGGLTEKAANYARQQQRLTKIGRTFAEIDGSLEVAARHFERIERAVRAAGKAASFVGIALAILDGGIAIYEVAIGKAEVDELVTRLGKAVVGGASSWAVGELAAGAAASAGATGAVPIAVAIIVGTATYLVIDWAIDATAASLKVGYLTTDDVKRVWPDGLRGVPLDRLYRKPKDPAVLLKQSTPSAK